MMVSSSVPMFALLCPAADSELEDFPWWIWPVIRQGDDVNAKYVSQLTLDARVVNAKVFDTKSSQTALQAVFTDSAGNIVTGVTLKSLGNNQFTVYSDMPVSQLVITEGAGKSKVVLAEINLNASK